ncbi:B-cell receptor CD22-like [Colossoma macropomum]|uniref:B-cell receptor CD22-like n=1 Tax=Colossoma macropomum TaxID=42526 RepID=UPI0018643CF6|nr:B-cell receptor CD22-like [Colossoma macropomum]
MIVGAFGTEWSVKFNQREICALKGSTVFMNGTYTHPEGLTVNETFWCLEVPWVDLTDLSKDPDYSGRVEYFTDEQKHFSLKLSDVMKKDEHQFCFRIITDVDKEKWLGKSGVQLRVAELHVETPEEVTEGETADLTCKTTCSLTDPTFIWYKNGRPLTTKTIKNNQLHLQTVSSEDAGSYSCAVRGYQHLHSTAQNLRVRYPPNNVSVSISPSGEIVEGSSLTLTCSSDANPPVKIYTWFKEGGTSPVGSGQNYSIISITADHTGLYYCEAQNEHGALKGTMMNADRNAKDDTYTALQPTARSSDDVYHTLAAVQSSSPDALYTALDPQSSSPEYDTLAALRETASIVRW